MAWPHTHINKQINITRKHKTWNWDHLLKTPKILNHNLIFYLWLQGKLILPSFQNQLQISAPDNKAPPSSQPSFPVSFSKWIVLSRPKIWAKCIWLIPNHHIFFFWNVYLLALFLACKVLHKKAAQCQRSDPRGHTLCQHPDLMKHLIRQCPHWADELPCGPQRTTVIIRREGRTEGPGNGSSHGSEIIQRWFPTRLPAHTRW